jgi:hypothetical protein
MAFLAEHVGWPVSAVLLEVLGAGVLMLVGLLRQV